MKYLGVSFFSLLLFLGGCSLREEKGGNSQPLTGKGEISYAKVYSAILKPYCVGCHAGMHAPSLANYNEVKAHLVSVEHAVLVKKSMPKSGPLPEAESQLLKAWIENGAPEFVAKADPSPTPHVGPRPIIKWDEVSREVLKPKCFNCHYANNPENISNLDDYSIFVETAGTSYFVTVIHPTMPPPPKGHPEGEPNPNKLTQSEMDLFSAWIVDGMQK